LLTVWLSLRRFYREKWWEAKLHAYTELVHAIHNIKRDVEVSIMALEMGRDTDTEFYKEWSNKHRLAWDEVRKDIDIGEFLFSEKSIKILQRLQDETKSDPATDVYPDYLEKLRAAVDKCLPAIKLAAREDLGLVSIWPRPK
jgi:hypothetical protein